MKSRSNSSNRIESVPRTNSRSRSLIMSSYSSESDNSDQYDDENVVEEINFEEIVSLNSNWRKEIKEIKIEQNPINVALNLFSKSLKIENDPSFSEKPKFSKESIFGNQIKKVYNISRPRTPRSGKRRKGK